MFSSYEVKKNTAKGLVGYAKKVTALTLQSARELALQCAKKAPGVGVVVIDSAGEPVFDTLAAKPAPKLRKVGRRRRKKG